MRRIAVGLVVCIAALGGEGCKSTQGPQPGTRIERGAAPTYEEVAAAYNKRVEPLERLWARTVVRLKFIDGDGQEQKEQVEGFCQYVRPTSALVTFTKVGQSIGMLGSNDTKYWWIELGKNKRAYVGQHANVTPERIASAGLRVHPLDLMELLALTALPGEGSVKWTEDGRSLLVTIKGRMGTRRLTVDPVTHAPSRIELVGENGRVMAFSELSGYENVAMKGAGPGAPRPRVPTKVNFEADGGATKIIMDLSDPQNDPSRFKPVAFDLDRLLEINEVLEVVDLDQERRAERAR